MTLITLDPCPTEDSTDCYWDATHHGNGAGQSFFDVGGEVTYFTVPAGMRVDTLTVTPATGDEYVSTASWNVTFADVAVPSTPPTGALPETGSQGDPLLWVIVGIAAVLAGGMLRNRNAR